MIPAIDPLMTRLSVTTPAVWINIMSRISFASGHDAWMRVS